MTTVEQIIDQDREELRIRWKKKHGRMKGANTAYRRQGIRNKAKALKLIDKMIKETR